jgi:hypothetical protein
MLDLLNNYSPTEIIIFIITISFSLKGVINFYDWAKERIKEPVDKVYDKKEIQKKILETLEIHGEQISRMSKSVDILIASDKDDIKA